MELALYTPGMGYYSGGAPKFGAAGDFITAPELTPLFAQTLAVQAAQILRLTAPQILEAGAGNGLLAAELLLELERLDTLPERYLILELSGELRQRQQAALAEHAPHLARRVAWLERLPQNFSGLVLGNELLDAMPVHLVAWRDSGIFERGVALDDKGGFAWQEHLAQGALLAAAQALPVNGRDEPYVSEIGLAARAWIAEWGRLLERGMLLLLDYGYPQCEYYHAQRRSGSLMCHYRHRAHDNPFHLPGRCDITAHVDFSAIAEAGCNAGLDLLGYTSQAQFLINCGIGEQLTRHNPATEPPELARAVGKLINPQEMGESFKAIALGRNVPEPLTGFIEGDRSHRL